MRAIDRVASTSPGVILVAGSMVPSVHGDADCDGDVHMDEVIAILEEVAGIPPGSRATNGGRGC